jgi:hypothetical protein
LPSLESITRNSAHLPVIIRSILQLLAAPFDIFTRAMDGVAGREDEGKRQHHRDLKNTLQLAHVLSGLNELFSLTPRQTNCVPGALHKEKEDLSPDPLNRTRLYAAVVRKHFDPIAFVTLYVSDAGCNEGCACE